MRANTAAMAQSPPRSDSSQGRIAAAGLVVVVVGTVLLGALLPNRPGPAPRAAADDPACLEWTDGCRVCQRVTGGTACSLPGIACDPGPQRCLRSGNG